MKISKFKVVTKYLTGGVTSVIEYLIDLFNQLIQTLPAAEVAKYSQLAKDIACFIQNLCSLITSEAKRNAAMLTAQAFADLATALLDSTLTKEELETIFASVNAAVKAWKEAK